MCFKSVLLIVVVLVNFTSTQYLQNCCADRTQWQYISYYPGLINTYSVYWPYVRYPIHYYYFRPPLSYHLYNPCAMTQPHCYELTKIYKCCVDYCGRTKCEQIYDCVIETIGSGDGPETDEEVTTTTNKCVNSEIVEFVEKYNNDHVNVDVIDSDYYYSDFVFDN